MQGESNFIDLRAKQRTKYSLFIMFFLNFNFLMTVPHILFVEAILGSFEFIFLNCQFFLSMFLRVL